MHSPHDTPELYTVRTSPRQDYKDAVISPPRLPLSSRQVSKVHQLTKPDYASDLLCCSGRPARTAAPVSSTPPATPLVLTAVVLADDNPSPLASDHLSAPALSPSRPSGPSAVEPLTSNTRAKRRRSSSSESSGGSTETGTQYIHARGRSSHRQPKRRRDAQETMRLTTDSPKPSRSPSQTFSNGSSNGVSPARRKAANGSSHSKTESNGSYANGNAVRAPQRPWFGHDREEVTRILIQSLTELGYHGAAGALCQESGYELEGPTVAAFRSAVLLGDWAEAEALLFGVESYDDGGGVGLGDGDTGIGNGKAAIRSSKSSWQSQGPAGGLTLAEGANKSEMMFWMRQQKYLELLEQRDLGAALMVLRQELTPLHQDTGRLHALSRCVAGAPIQAHERAAR